MPGIFDSTEIYSTPVVGPTPDSGLIAEPSSGIGMAPAPAPIAPKPALSLAARNEDMRAQMAQRPMGDRIAYALEAFGAGMKGQTSYAEREMKQKREDRLLQSQELKVDLSMFEDGAKIAQKLQGEGKTGFVDQWAQQMDARRPGWGASFKELSKTPSLITNIKEIMPYLPEPMQLVAKSDPDAFVKMASSSEGIKAMNDAKDRYELKGGSIKARTLLLGADQLDPAIAAKISNKEPLTPADFMTLNEAAKTNPQFKVAALTDDQLDSAARHSEMFFSPLGIADHKTMQGILLHKATPKTLQVDAGGTTKLIPENMVPAGGMDVTKTLKPGEEENIALRKQEIGLSRQRLAQAEAHHKDNIAQGKYGSPVELSIDGKNVVVVQEKKTGRLLDAAGNDVTAQVAPKISGGNMDPGRVSMMIQAHKDVNDAEALVFDKDGKLNKGLLAAADIPGTRGVGTDARKLYTAIENAVAGKLRAETGAATNPSEIENTAARFRPTVADTSESAKYKLDRLKEFMGSSIDQLRESGHISQKTYDSAKGTRAASTGPVKIKDEADFAALPSGAEFIDPKGNLRKKP